jgi:hypothetical protein
MLWIGRDNRSSFLVIGLLFSGTLLWANTTPGIKFIENKNQWPAGIHYSARVPGGTMLVRPGKFQYYFLDEERIEALHEQLHAKRNESDGGVAPGQMINGHAVEVNFIGANANASPSVSGRSTEYYNYFIGSDPDHWASRAYAYNEISYNNVYDNISMKIYSIDKHVKYDFVVKPYADPSQILLEYKGAEATFLSDGNLTVKTSVGDIIEQKPVAYQWIEGRKVMVSAEYKLEANQLSFCFPNGYDPCYELIIDPLLIFST